MRMTKAEREAADAAFRAEQQRRSEKRAVRERECEQHMFAFVRHHVPDFDPEKGSPMAVEYFDDLPKWLHEMVTDAQGDAEKAAGTEAEAAAKAAAEKAEQETYLATFKRMFDEKTAEAIAKREGRWVYDRSNNYEGRMLADHERIIDGKVVSIDPKVVSIACCPRGNRLTGKVEE